MILPLDKAAVLRPNRESIGIVGAWMLFPDDENGRAAHCLLHRAQRIIEGVTNGVQFTQAENLVALNVALEAPSPGQHNDLILDRFNLGYAAGMHLHNVCLRVARGEKSAMANSLRDIGGALFRSKAGTSKHVNEAVWKRFRPVAPYWAAMIHMDNETPDEWPCARSALPQFLAFAEAFRSLAEGTMIPHHGPVLKAGETVGLADEVRAVLPVGSFKVAPALA
jgi:hypothetical protein